MHHGSSRPNGKKLRERLSQSGNFSDPGAVFSSRKMITCTRGSKVTGCLIFVDVLVDACSDEHEEPFLRIEDIDLRLSMDLE